VLIGEIHGNYEMPRAFGAFVTSALRNGARVVVHLEVPRDCEPSFNRFLEKRSSKDQLLQTSFWKSDPFGRATKGFLELILTLRRLRETHPNTVRLSLFDAPVVDRPVIPTHREALMTTNIFRVYGKELGALHLIYTGNLHARTRPESSLDDGFHSLGMQLQRQEAHTRSVVLAYEGGTTRAVFVDGPLDRISGNGDAPVVSVEPCRFTTKQEGDLIALDLTYPWEWAFNVGRLTAASAART
jgi:hypothetical protein